MSETPSVEAVREALRMTGLAEFMFQEETLPVHVQAVRAAARDWLRIQENSKTIWWCDRHEASGSVEGEPCWYAEYLADDPRPLDGRCRMVARRLI